MGRDATKARGNPWYEARIEASKWDDRLSSREGAAAELNMSVDSVRAGLSKCMPVDKAVLMADRYNAPHLLNYYCLNECPIGRQRPLSDAAVGIDRVTVKLVKQTRVGELGEAMQKLLDITYDGDVSEDEMEDFEDVLDYFDELMKTISEIQTAGKRILNGRDKGGQGKRTRRNSKK